MSARDRRVVVAALGTTQILAWGSSYYLSAVLAQPIAESTGWPLATVVGGFSAGLLASGLVSPQVGRSIDRHGGRPVLAVSSVLIAAGQAALALATTLPGYYAAWLVIGLGMGAGLYDAAFSTLGRLYGAGARRAITAVTLFGGLASTICWPLSAVLVETVGWRGACLAYAALQIAVALPIHLLLIPRLGIGPTGAGAPQPEAAPAPARGRALTLLGGILVTGSLVSSIVSVHLLALLQADGADLATAVALGAVIGPAQVSARVVEMTVGSRYHPVWTMLAATVLIAAGMALLLAGLALAGFGLALYGAGNGIYSIARGTLPLALYGPDGYARLMGRLALPALVAAALAPSFGAVLLESGGPRVTVAALAAAAVLNIALVLALRAVSRRATP